jgi:hypothetical protein
MHIISLLWPTPHTLTIIDFLFFLNFPCFMSINILICFPYLTHKYFNTKVTPFNLSHTPSILMLFYYYFIFITININTNTTLTHNSNVYLYLPTTSFKTKSHHPLLVSRGGVVWRRRRLLSCLLL